jgi:hypothetical protein
VGPLFGVEPLHFTVGSNEALGERYGAADQENPERRHDKAQDRSRGQQSDALAALE